MSKFTLQPRYIKPLLLEALKDSPAVLIHGPRQCGKTTLARMLEKAKKYEYITFDDNRFIKAAQSDPNQFVNSLPKKAILDEVQKVPHLFSELKAVIDQQRISGRFILTGSANIFQTPRLSDSLAGRIEILRLHPLSKGELNRKKSTFLDTLFKGQFRMGKMKNSLDQIIDQIIRGGFPAVMNRPLEKRRSHWYRNYIKSLIQYDISDLSKIRSSNIIPRLLTLCASQTAQLVNFTKLSSDFQISRTTIHDYIGLLEQMFFLEKLPPWYNNLSRRLIKTSKLHIGDTGLASALLGVNTKSLKANRPLLGQLLETFVVQELRRQSSYHREPHSLFYYRDKKGYEVDIVIERGRLVSGVEVKASATVNSSDFKGLYKLKTAAGRNFVCGVVLYNGEVSVPFGKSFYAVPLSIL